MTVAFSTFSLPNYPSETAGTIAYSAPAETAGSVAFSSAPASSSSSSSGFCAIA